MGADYTARSFGGEVSAAAYAPDWDEGCGACKDMSKLGRSKREHCQSACGYWPAEVLRERSAAAARRRQR